MAQFAGEVAAVIACGGEALVRERVAVLDEGQRRALREVLDVSTGH